MMPANHTTIKLHPSMTKAISWSLALTMFFSASLPLSIQANSPPPIPKGIISLDGQAAPPIKLDNIDGEPYDLRQARGHWAFVHFWASWCGPCRREMPSIQRMATQLKQSTLELVIVNTAETEDEIFNFIGIHAPDLTPLLDTGGLVTQQWQPRGLPSTFLVGPDGKLRYLALGGREWDSPAYLDFLRSLTATAQAPPKTIENE